VLFTRAKRNAKLLAASLPTLGGATQNVLFYFYSCRIAKGKALLLSLRFRGKLRQCKRTFKTYLHIQFKQSWQTFKFVFLAGSSTRYFFRHRIALKLKKINKIILVVIIGRQLPLAKLDRFCRTCKCILKYKKTSFKGSFKLAKFLSKMSKLLRHNLRLF